MHNSQKGNKNMHLGENVYHNNNVYNCQIINKYSWTLRHSISAIDHASFDGAV